MDTTERFINEFMLIKLSPLFPERDFSNGVLRGFIFKIKMGLEDRCQGCRSGNECEQKEYDTHSNRYGHSCEEDDNKNLGRYDLGKKRRQYH